MKWLPQSPNWAQASDEKTGWTTNHGRNLLLELPALKDLIAAGRVQGDKNKTGKPNETNHDGEL